jgi:hypothetical protein
MANSVLQGVQSPNAGMGLLDAISSGQNIHAQGQMNQMRQQEVSEGDYKAAVRKMQIANKLAKKALTLPPEGRAQLMRDYSGALYSVGFTDEDLARTPMDDAGLQNFVAQTDSVLASVMPQSQTRVQSSQILDDGTTVQVMTDGGVRVTDATGNPLSGKAASDAVRAAQSYGTDLQGDRAGSRTRSTLETRQDLEPTLKGDITQAVQDVKLATEPTIKAAEKTAVQSAENRTIYKTQALAAAENVPTLKRALQLQKEIMSGGGANTLRKMANYLGVSSADEGELNSLFGQNILGQLKSTFGGNPTEGERLALEQAQASFSQTGKINARLLENALKLADLRIRRGRSAAQTDKDEDTLNYINDAMSIEFGDEDEVAPAATTTPASGGWSIKPLGQ